MKFMKLHDDAIFPTRKGLDAGYDLYASHNAMPYVGKLSAGGEFEPSEDEVSKVVTMVHTGIAVAIPPGYVGLIKDRSSLAGNQMGEDRYEDTFHTVAGVVDSGYRGEIIVVFHGPAYIRKGMKFAQMIVVPCLLEDVEEVDELPESSDGRGTKGFGSSGK